MATNEKVKIIGAGLAGADAAYYLAERGIKVELCDMKPKKFSPAHKSEKFGELVCSNSLKSNDVYGNACGLLKEEMRIIGSLVIEAADNNTVPAGNALAVNRDGFSDYLTKKLKNHKNIEIKTEEATDFKDDGYSIIATGPLTSEPLAEYIKGRFGEGLHFYDASAPIVSAESIDMNHAFIGDRYGKGDGDYINCPMNKEEYEAFVDGLITAEKVTLHDFEKRDVFDGCMPVEIMASRGKDTLRFGNLKPVGLRDKDGNRFYAVLQLRKENEEGTAYNLVGCQTNLKFGEQKRVFSVIPALKNAEYLRYGVMHRNTYINSPKLLNSDFSLKEESNVYFAGQISGVEGYVESAMSGLLAAFHLERKLKGKEKTTFPSTTVCGALSAYVSSYTGDFQPMNANYGILRPLESEVRDKALKKRMFAERALRSAEKLKEYAESAFAEQEL